MENKDLLIKDICARVPFGLKALVLKHYGSWAKPFNEDVNVLSVFPKDKKVIVEDAKGVSLTCNLNETKDEFIPYLKPMDRLTDEELNYLEIDCKGNWGKDSIDYLNEHFYDYRGLIELGLAKAAPENMYK